MNLDEYQKLAKETAVYKETLIYPALGLGGETFEFLAKMGDPSLVEISKEIGDICWYIAAIASDCDLKLSEIAGVETFEELEGYPKADWIIIELAKGLAEVLETIKKILRDNNGILLPEKIIKIQYGLKIILNALKEYTIEMDISLSDIAQQNIDKLFSRKDRGVIQGSGDNR